MTLQEVEFDGDLWFFAERDSNPVAHVTASPQVNVGVGSGRHLGVAHRRRRRRGRRGEEARALEQRRRGLVPAGPGRRRRRPAQGGGRLRGVLGQPRRTAGDGVQLRQGQGDRSSGSRAGRTRRSTSDAGPGQAVRGVRQPLDGGRARLGRDRHAAVARWTSRSGRPARGGRTGSPGPGRSRGRASACALVLGLHALGDDVEAQRAGELDDRGDQGGRRPAGAAGR